MRAWWCGLCCSLCSLPASAVSYGAVTPRPHTMPLLPIGPLLPTGEEKPRKLVRIRFEVELLRVAIGHRIREDRHPRRLRGDQLDRFRVSLSPLVRIYCRATCVHELPDLRIVRVVIARIGEEVWQYSRDVVNRIAAPGPQLHRVLSGERTLHLGGNLQLSDLRVYAHGLQVPLHRASPLRQFIGHQLGV